MLEAIEHRVGPLAASGVVDDEEGGEDEGDAQLFIVRFVRDACTIRADASGALLHLRGYRQALARAPLRETLAASMLLGSGWDGASPLLDPMCGSGTIPIEAALIARRIAPGLAEPGSRAPRLRVHLLAGVRRGTLGAGSWTARCEEILPPRRVPILGSDRDEGAIEAAASNAARAGVSEDVDLSVRPVSAIDPPPGPGWMVINPPYGVRVGERDPLRNLYAALGRTLRDALPRLDARAPLAGSRAGAAGRHPAGRGAAHQQRRHPRAAGGRPRAGGRRSRSLPEDTCLGPVFVERVQPARSCHSGDGTSRS